MQILRLNFLTKFLTNNLNKTYLVLIINGNFSLITCFYISLIPVYFESKINKLKQDNNIREANLGFILIGFQRHQIRLMKYLIF